LEGNVVPKRVLVADDDPAMLDVLRLIFEEGGYAVETAPGERAVLAKLDPPPDLIMLDVRLSGADGRELCRRLKQRDATKAIPIVMISASAAAEKPAEPCGADAFVAKPFDVDDFLDLVARLIGDAAPFVPGLDRTGEFGEDCAP
jgi:CheY-like chemotaxis protein